MYLFIGGYTYLHFGMLPLPKCSLTTGILADFTQVNGEKQNLWMLRLYWESYYPVCWVLCFCHYEGSGSKPTMIISWKIAERAVFFVASFVDISFGTTYHRKFQVPKMEVLYLIRLFQGVGIPLHRPHILLLEVSTSNSNQNILPSWELTYPFRKA